MLYLLEGMTFQAEEDQTSNQFVEIYPNYSNLESDKRSSTEDILYIGINGSLMFQNTHSYHSGKYLCHVSNGIGHAIHQIVQVNIKGNL